MRLILAFFFFGLAGAISPMRIALQYVRWRTGFRTKVWHYSGAMRSINGRNTVGIQGLESIKYLGGNTTCHRYISRKAFLYVDSTNTSAVIDEFAVSKLSPVRQVESKRLLNEIVSIGVNNKGQIFTTISLPAARMLSSNTVHVSAEDVDSEVELSQFVAGKHENKYFSTKFVTFSGAPDEGHGRNQEKYAIYFPKKTLLQRLRSMLSPSDATAVMTCHRIGECPYWFSPSQACSTDLKASGYLSIDDVPKNITRMFQTHCPEFFSVEFGDESSFNSLSSQAKRSILQKNFRAFNFASFLAFSSAKAIVSKLLSPSVTNNSASLK
jgi:hypothetical protein